MNTTIKCDRTAQLNLQQCVHRALMRPVARQRLIVFALGLAGLGAQPAAATAFPAEVELSSLQSANGGDGSLGMVANGIGLSDSIGLSMRNAGDVNDDGVDDVIIGSLRTDADECYVVFGTSAGAAEFEMSTLLAVNNGDGSAGFVIKGIDSDDRNCASVSGAGDVNGDGVADILVGANGGDPANVIRGGTPPTRVNAGETYVIFGTALGFPAEFETSDLLAANGGTGNTGFVINGIDSSDRAGFRVSGAGDINDDGFDDMIIGDLDQRAYLVFGTDQGFAAEFELSSLLSANGGDGSAGVILNVPPGFINASSVNPAGDVNGDGIDDVLLGSRNGSPGGRYGAGQTVVLFGSDTGFPAELALSSLLLVNGGDGSAGFVINGVSASDQSGESVDGAGDVNGDGFDDIIIGAERTDFPGRSDAGQTYIVFGTDQGFGAEFELSTLLAANAGDGTTGFAINGAAAEDHSGVSVSRAGDINGDGVADVIIGAYYASPPGRSYAGESYILFGSTSVFPAEIELSSLHSENGGDGTAGVVLNGISEEDYAGSVVSAAGDFNGDGVSDVLISAPEVTTNINREGQVYIVYGRVAVDTDADGIADSNDNCTTAFNPDQCDTDADGFGNLCDADLDNNNWVNFDDLGDFSNAFMSTPGMGNWNPQADFDCNDMVNFDDLGIIRSLFFGLPGPAGTQ